FFFFFQAEDGIRDFHVTGVQTCALPISMVEDGKITAAQANDARSAPLTLRLAHDPNSLAPYFVEEIRRYLEGKFGTDQVHEGGLDRKSTRLNSSHVKISYAVFCLKKKKA